MNRLREAIDEDIWLAWNKRDMGNGKSTKIPMTRDNKFGSSTSKETWMSYEEALNVIRERRYAGLGIVFPPHKKLVGVDLDHVLKWSKEEGKLLEYKGVKAFLKYCNTYVEISPSKEGLHAYFLTSDTLQLESNKHKINDTIGYEVYNTGRFFTVTGDVYQDNPVRTISSDELIKLLGKLGYPWNVNKAVKTATTFQMPQFNDGDVLAKAYESKNGSKIKALYNGDISAYSDDESSADLAFTSHIAFFSGSRDQTERIWLNSPLGQRSKTLKREDYRTMTLDKAFQGKDSFYDPTGISQSITNSRSSIMFSDGKTPEQIKNAIRNSMKGIPLLTTEHEPKIIYDNVHNVSALLHRHPLYQGRIRYNQFDQKVYLDGHYITDTDIINIQSEFQRNFLSEKRLATISKTIIFDSILLAASKNPFHPIREWLDSLKWDGEHRLDSWIDNVCGYPENDNKDFFEYREQVGINTIKAMVARIYNPGCKYDYIFVLEGKQGCGKSTLLSTLASTEYRIETSSSVDNKDFYMDTLGKWVVELAEGETLSRSSVNSIKSMASRSVDTFRKPYGKVSEDVPRQFVLAMTTNEGVYLKDSTGNRRFMPITVNLDFVDLNWLLDNRDQMFAEAVHMYKQDSSFNYSYAEAQKQQEQRAETDVYVEDVEEAWDNFSETEQREGLTVYEVWEKTNRSSYGATPQHWEILQITKVLRNLGMQKKRATRNLPGGNQKRVTVWHDPRIPKVHL